MLIIDFFWHFDNLMKFKDVFEPMKKLLQSTFFSVFLIMTSTSSFAQNDDPLLDNSMRDALTIVALGSVGAVLGLSTLSFVDEPKDHLKNIVVGGAIGIIVGVGFVAWGQASKSADTYQNSFASTESLNPADYPTYARRNWHHKAHYTSIVPALNNNQLTGHIGSYTFSF